MNRLRMVEEKKEKEAEEEGYLVEVEPISCGHRQHEAELVQYEVCRMSEGWHNVLLFTHSQDIFWDELNKG